MSKNTPTLLEDQLEAYSSAAQATDVLKSFPDWARRLPLYAAAAGSALAFTTGAQAAIIYSGVQNVTATLPGPFNGATIQSTKAINIDGASFFIHVQGFIRNAFHYGVAGINAHSSNQIGVVPNPRYGINLAKKFSSGANIANGMLAGGYAYLHFQSSTSPRGNFAPGQVGLLGLKIGTGANEHLGWLRAKFTNTAGGYPGSITAIDWAYNSVANASITAGDVGTTASPEPGTASLALLAAGSAGVLAWRRRRQSFISKAE